MKPIVFESRHRPRFSEIDLNGHLNTACYFDYFSENRHIGHREILGFDLASFAKLPFEVVTAKSSFSYFRPIWPDQEFIVRSWVQQTQDSRSNIHCEFQDSSGRLLTSGEIQLCCIDRETKKPVAFPDDFLLRFYSRQ